nr:hypothetical protein CFP56_75797 [Quercus suber]
MLPFVHVVTKSFKPDNNVVHSWDLNFVLCSEIFVHYDGQLRASHLILECIPSYTSYQDLGQALIVGSPLLSYLDVCLRCFLLRGLTLGEAQRLGPRQIREGSLLLVKDSSVDRVFHGRVEHILVEEPAAAVFIPVANPILVEETESDKSDTEMVVWKKMIADHYLPGAAQMTHMLEGQLKGAVEEAEKERALKEVFEATLWDQVTALATAKRRATEAKRSCDAEVRLVQVESVISARDKEEADLNVAMAQSEDKFYNMGFANAKNSSEPIMLESWHYGFREGWMAAVYALDPTQNEKEDSLSMRELVGEIDSHTEVIELNILSNPTIAEGQMPQSTLSNPDPQMVTGVPPNPPEHALNPEA